jgi:hypothetical protein
LSLTFSAVAEFCRIIIFDGTYFGGGGGNTYGGEARYIKGFGSGNVGERDKLKDPGVSGRIILKWIFRK